MTPSRDRARAARLLAGALLAVLTALPAMAGAQRRQTVFVHGLNSNGASWQKAADALRNEFYIDTYRPDLAWSLRLDIQTGQLSDFMNARGLPGNTLVFGHSNGGLISRRTNQFGRGMGGLMTVGTLHRGAILSENVRNGNVFLWGSIIAGDIADAYNTYYWYPKPWYEDWFFWALYPYAAVANFMGRVLPYAVEGVGMGFQNNPVEVGQDMVPWSGFLEDPTTGLNSVGNLGREAFALPYRIGVTSNLNHPYGITWKGVAPGSWEALTWWQYGSAFVFAATYEYYANYWDYNDPYYYDKRWNAWLWARAAFTMVDMDPVWCWMIGVWNDGAWTCAPSDGIVPSASQFYPQPTHFYNIYGPAHTEEKQSPQLAGVLQHLMRDVYQVPTCASTGITSFTVSPGSISLEQYRGASLSAVSRNGCGQVVGGQSISWWSSDDAIASVSSTGYVYGNWPGSATIYARNNATGATSSASVYVYEYVPPDDGCTVAYDMMLIRCMPTPYSRQQAPGAGTPGTGAPKGKARPSTRAAPGH